MRCPYCNFEETRVIDTRESGECTRRRRECLECGRRFTTYERFELLNLTVLKKNGSREQFDRNKVKSGILKAVEKRPITEEQVDLIVDRIENELRGMGSEEIESKVIGELVMRELRKIDPVAYLRFASVYRQFSDITSFEKELKNLKEEKL
ncbi:MAG: transcriptional regulator NrdR [Candidatus Aenigmatarchaeota archaeon]|nr:MAG: transcriptional regulator NrdR [Candidatus Aenigmarchaeota archaeon]